MLANIRSTKASTTGVRFLIAALSLLAPSCNRQPPTANASSSSAPALFSISKNEKFGFIGSAGQVVIEPQFDSVSDFSEGLAAICVGPCKFVTEDNDPLTFVGKWGFIDTTGKIIINPQFTVGVGAFHRGLAWATTQKHGERAGYIDKTGNFVIPEQFQLAHDFDDQTGFARVCVGMGNDHRCGYIDTSGKFVINPQFFEVYDFKNGLAMIRERKEMSVSYIDHAGRVVWKGEPWKNTSEAAPGSPGRPWDVLSERAVGPPDDGWITVLGPSTKQSQPRIQRAPDQQPMDISDLVKSTRQSQPRPPKSK